MLSLPANSFQGVLKVLSRVVSVVSTPLPALLLPCTLVKELNAASAFVIFVEHVLHILAGGDKVVVSLLDYGAGNVRSVRNAIKASGCVRTDLISQMSLIFSRYVSHRSFLHTFVSLPPTAALV